MSEPVFVTYRPPPVAPPISGELEGNEALTNEIFTTILARRDVDVLLDLNKPS